MIYKEIIKGKFVYLVAAQVEDTEFILSLRNNPALNKYISKTENNIEKQRQWIAKQQERKGDYYFIIKDKDNSKIGTISIYNIENKEGEFGRWLLNGNSIHALESALLIHEFGFYVLDLDIIYSYTVIENKKVINFHKRFGASLSNETKEHPIEGFLMQKAFIKKDDFFEIKNKNYKLIEKFL
jgi:RimJ/RimL family protein N-acetyltransferase